MTLFDGEHTTTNISLYAFVFGSMFGGGILFAINGPHAEFALYIAGLGLFHELEYLMTSMYNAPKLSLDSYIINQSDEYQMAIAACIVEYWVEALLFPSLKSNLLLLKSIGFCLLVLGQAFRTLAMHHAKSNFSHVISTSKSQEHELVTAGVYSVSRHPSYFGFFWFSVGTQLLLCNPICLGLYIYANSKFFGSRIPFEEIHLEKFFGQKYVDYKASVPIGIPFMPKEN